MRFSLKANGNLIIYPLSEFLGHRLTRLRGKAVNPPEWLTRYRASHKPANTENDPHPGTVTKSALPVCEKSKGKEKRGEKKKTNEKDTKATETASKVEGTGTKKVELPPFQQKTVSLHIGTAISVESPMSTKEKVQTPSEK